MLVLPGLLVDRDNSMDTAILHGWETHTIVHSHESLDHDKKNLRSAVRMEDSFIALLLPLGSCAQDTMTVMGASSSDEKYSPFISLSAIRDWVTSFFIGN